MELIDRRRKALAEFFNVDIEEIEQSNNFDDTMLECTTEAGEYYVLLDYEADELADELLDQYIDECLMIDVNLPEHVERYMSFDSDKFKSDVIMYDGRGHVISSWDGQEHESGEFLIYRV